MQEDPRYHIRLEPSDVGRYVLMPGDRDRVPLLAKHLEGARLVAENREYRTMTGTLDGSAVSIVSSGMGSPALAIGVEELRTAGVHTIIRVGTAGALGPGPKLGDAVIAMGAVRAEGTTRAYVDLEFPAVADFEVTDTLRAAAVRANHPYHVGIVASTDAYYAGQWPMAVATNQLERFASAGALAVEMEASALFVVGRLRGLRTGCILTVREEVRGGGERIQGGADFDRGLEKNIAIAVEAVRALIRASG